MKTNSKRTVTWQFKRYIKSFQVILLQLIKSLNIRKTLCMVYFNNKNKNLILRIFLRIILRNNGYLSTIGLSPFLNETRYLDRNKKILDETACSPL